MTREYYQRQGYEVSSYIDEATIDRAERDVRAAYIAPIVGAAEIPDEQLQPIVANLAFLLLLQRTIFATRAGAKTKTGYNSADADAWAKLQQEATACHLKLETLRTFPGVNTTAKVQDICKIYFKTNFISL